MSSAERLRRSLRLAGVEEANRPIPGRRHLLLRTDHVYHPALVRDLAQATRDTVLVGAGGEAAAAVCASSLARSVARALAAQGALPEGMRRTDAEGLSAGYDKALRRRRPTYLLPLDSQTLAEAERQTFAGSYKGVTDLVTKYLWPRPALAVTRWCAERGVTPNAVTGTSLLLVLLAMAAFAQGWFLTGLPAAWAMTFLDTVDGKLARVTLTSSRFGEVLDHGIDLIHPPFWYWAWIIGLQGGLPHAGPVLAVIVGGYVLQRFQEGLFIALFKIEMHVWRPFDSRFRLITARRNPNLILLTAAALAGRPDLGIAAVAVWTAVCLGVHSVRIVQALAARRRGPLTSWLAA